MIENFPPHSRIWIYQANRTINEYELLDVQQVLQQFTAQWQAHNVQLMAAAQVFYNRFIVFCVDETIEPPSGCSIDKSVQIIKQLGEKYNIDFFDRLQIAYKQEEEIKTFRLNDFKQLVAEGSITPTTIIFNNLVMNKGEMETQWEIPVQESWLAQRLPQTI